MIREPWLQSKAVHPRGIKDIAVLARIFPRLERAALNNGRDTHHESESACVDLETTAGLAAGAETFMAHRSMLAERKGCIETRVLRMMFQFLRVLQEERTFCPKPRVRCTNKNELDMAGRSRTNLF